MTLTVIYSPYTNPLTRFYIGPNKKRYYVRRDLLQRPEWMNSNSGWLGPSVDLPSIDEDTGHTLVHYLHTGAYETLDNLDVSTADHERVELKRAIRTYFTARTYDLSGLQQLAMDNIECYGMRLSVIDVFELIDQEFPKFEDESGSFYEYLKKIFRVRFEDNYAFFTKGTPFNRIHNVQLNRILVECVMELYDTVVSRKINRTNCVQAVLEGGSGGGNDEHNSHNLRDLADRTAERRGGIEHRKIEEEEVKHERAEHEEVKHERAEREEVEHERVEREELKRETEEEAAATASVASTDDWELCCAAATEMKNDK